MKTHKIGIVGVGKLGEFHCNVISLLATAKLIGVYDKNKNRKLIIADKYRCKAFCNVEELFESVDIVGIAVPTVDHLKIARQALEYKKPVFIEKPIAVTESEAQELITISKACGVPIQVGHIERFNPAILSLSRFNLEPMFIESHRLAPFDPRGTDVAVVLDLMIHDIDVILSLVDGEISKIDASGVAVISDEIDIANARIKFKNGCVANVTASRISKQKMRKMRLFQRDSYISIDFLTKQSEVFRISDKRLNGKSASALGQIERGSKKKHIIHENPPVSSHNAMEAEWTSFIRAIETDQKPVVSGEDGLKALKVAREIIDLINRDKSEQAESEG